MRGTGCTDVLLYFKFPVTKSRRGVMPCERLQKRSSPMGIALSILAVAAILAIFLFNSLIGKKNQVTNVFASVDALLKKRYDLIPNLVSAVKTYMQHEKQLLTELSKIRSRAISREISHDEKIDLDNRLSKVLGTVMVAVENYPDLKASSNFLHLQSSMNEVEEQISAARRAYNATVTEYNNAVEMFPTSILAAIMNLKRKEVFVISPEERQNVDVGNLFGTGS
jgi:LemA protein